MSTSGLPTEVDTIVIGAGTGGCGFTNILATHSGDDILVLEAGPDYGQRDSGTWPADVLDAKSVPLSHDWFLEGWGSAGHTRDLPRAKVVGGCSSHNGCTISRGARYDYDEWARGGNPGWEAETVEPLLDWGHRLFRTRRYTMGELTVAQAAFVRAGIDSGLPFADDLDDLEAAAGIGPMPVNIVDGVRWNASFAFLDPIRDRPHVTIAGNAEVQRILLDRGRVTGVLVALPGGGVTTVRATRVVLAGGAYHSPGLLLRSGIGAADALRGVGVDCLIDLPAVGEHLQDHICVQLDFRGRDGLLDELALTPWNPDEQTVGRARSSQCDPGPYDMHVFMVAGANSGHPGLPPISLYAGAMRAKSEGQVRITSPDGTLAIDHRYGTDPEGHDLAVLREAQDLLESISAQPELAAILGDAVIGDTPPLKNIAPYCHPVGTCRMGPDPGRGAVVDHTGRVHGVDGLYVADASLMPAITRGNINLPTAMIGARVASGLVGIEPRLAVAARSTTS